MAEDYAKDVLVTTDWLAERLGDSGVAVAEVDENTDLYEEGHIPGAVKLHWRDDLQDAIERDLVEQPEFEELMGARGIGNDTTVVLYGDKNNWFAAYAYWYLKIYGHRDVRLLDGGRQKWIDEGRELTTDAPAVTSAAYSAAPRDESIRVYHGSDPDQRPESPCPAAQMIHFAGALPFGHGRGLTPERTIRPWPSS
jgi:thiosulfate/3-mercaptopyruvate sulfurtransferase